MHKIAIITTCFEQWGGSEELWARSIPFLAKEGIRISVYKDRINRQHPRWAGLAEQGVDLKELKTSKGAYLAEKMRRAFKRQYWYRQHQLMETFTRALRKDRPNLVVIAQGINFDGLGYAQLCLSLDIPYVVICQKAVEFYWPPAGERSGMVRALKHAARCYFVSRQNQVLTEEQFGLRLANAQLIYNPVDRSGSLLPYPSAQEGYRLACIGRLFIIDKGQDILLRLLSRPKWRNRPIQVSFIGTGTDEEGLKEMARLLDVTNVSFTGQLANVHEVWASHHALVLPSRSEGLPLVVLEAMAAGRTVVTTTAGGSREIIEEGITGFIGESGEEAFDQALEKAWERRSDWEAMGRAAHDDLKNKLPANPAEEEFARSLILMLHDR